MSSYIAKRAAYDVTPYAFIRRRSIPAVKAAAAWKILGAYRAMKARRTAVDRYHEIMDREIGGSFYSLGRRAFPRTDLMRGTLRRARSKWYRSQRDRLIGARFIQSVYRGYRVRKNLPRFRGI